MKIQDPSFAAQTVDEQIDQYAKPPDQQSQPLSLNERLVRDLSQLYANASYSRQLERSLEHIWQRLGSHGVQATNKGIDEHQRNDDMGIPGLQRRDDRQWQKIDHSVHSIHPVRQKLITRLSSLVAVLLVALLVGSLVLTLLAAHHAANNAGRPSRPSVVTVHMGSDSFLQSSVTLQQGMMLALVNDTAVVHVIENGYWKDISAFVRLHEPGMSASPVVFQSQHEVHRIGPLNIPGIYHLFDSIHAAMNLLIMVQQSSTPVSGSPTPNGNTVRVVLWPGYFQPVKTIIHVRMSLLLINNALVEHIIKNGYWQGDKLILKRELGMPQVDIDVQPGQQGWVGPFNKVGTYHLVDTVHVGMNLTIVVQ